MPKASEVQEMILKVVSNSNNLAYRLNGEVLEVLAPPAEGENQSTAVQIISKDFNESKVVVLLKATVIHDLPTDDPELSIKGSLLCNELNQDQMFGRWVYYAEDGTIMLEHELVGETLGTGEIMNIVATLGHQADRWDETIQSGLGAGQRLLQSSI